MDLSIASRIGVKPYEEMEGEEEVLLMGLVDGVYAWNGKQGPYNGIVRRTPDGEVILKFNESITALASAPENMVKLY